MDRKTHHHLVHCSPLQILCLHLNLKHTQCFKHTYKIMIYCKILHVSFLDFQDSILVCCMEF